MAMFMLPVTALDVAGIEKKLLQTMEMITAKKRKVSSMVMMVLVKTTERRGRCAGWFWRWLQRLEILA